MKTSEYSIQESNMLRGFDISIFVSRVDWSTAIASTGARFAFLECARGLEIGPKFSDLWQARPASIICGPYQRLFSVASGEDQAHAFMDAVSKAGLLSTDLPPVLDVEADPDGRRATPNEYVALMNDWVTVIQQQLGRQPMIYTNPAFWGYLGSPAQFGRLPLWIADYKVAVPKVPNPWTTYSFWQYEQTATVAGVDKAVDLDVFNGNENALSRLVESSVL